MRRHHSAAFAAIGLIVVGAVSVGIATAQENSAAAAPTATQQRARPASVNRGRDGRGGEAEDAATITSARLAAFKALYAVRPAIADPADNPSTPAKVALGRDLFFDPSLSANGKIACATCHDARKGFSDGLRRSVGVKGEELARHTPSVMNLAWMETFFWDGRAKSLEQQALMPIADAKEMGMPHEAMVARIEANDDYRRQFEVAFPGEGVSVANVARAIATFERTLVFGGQAPFDRWIAGEEDAISAAAKRGFADFNTTGGCAQCHTGWNFSDGKFHNVGLDDNDVGRFGVTSEEALKYWFRTPSLRNVGLHAPYMHNGIIPKLDDVVWFYQRNFILREPLSPEMAKVRPGDRYDLAAFLETLTSPIPTELVSLQEALERKIKADAAPAVVANALP
jgi:cytochrome c peroxidase